MLKLTETAYKTLKNSEGLRIRPFKNECEYVVRNLQNLVFIPGCDRAAQYFRFNDVIGWTIFYAMTRYPDVQLSPSVYISDAGFCRQYIWDR